MRFRNFLIASTLGTAAWTTLLAVAGYKLGENVGDVESTIGPISNAIIVILAAAYVWRLVRYKPDRPAEDGSGTE
jgi:membrane protein DedA with SNARE-associated domain